MQETLTLAMRLCIEPNQESKILEKRLKNRVMAKIYIDKLGNVKCEKIIDETGCIYTDDIDCFNKNLEKIKVRNIYMSKNDQLHYGNKSEKEIVKIATPIKYVVPLFK